MGASAVDRLSAAEILDGWADQLEAINRKVGNAGLLEVEAHFTARRIDALRMGVEALRSHDCRPTTMRFATDEMVQAIVLGTKTVTRRLARGERSRWREGCLARPVGPRMKGPVVQIVSVQRQWLEAITGPEVAREGFPELGAAEFCDYFRDLYNLQALKPVEVDRVEFAIVGGHHAT